MIFEPISGTIDAGKNAEKWRFLVKILALGF